MISAHSLLHLLAKLLAHLTDRLRPKDPQLDNDLARPNSQDHVSGYSLDCETGPSQSQLLHFCLGNGQGPGGVSVVLEGRGAQTLPVLL